MRYKMNYLIFIIGIFSLLGGILKVYLLKENPYVHWFDKVLIIIFMPLIGVLLFLFVIMVFGMISRVLVFELLR